MTDQAQAVEDAEAAMMRVLEAEETLSEEPEEIEEEAAQEAEETEETLEATEETEEQPAEEPTETIIHNGEEKVLTKSELKTLAQQGFDYTQKTQQLSDERKSVQAEMQAARIREYVNTAVRDDEVILRNIEDQLAQFDQVDWQTLIATDPQQAMQYTHHKSQLRELKEQKQAEINQKKEQAFTALQEAGRQKVQAEMALLARKVPELVNGEKAAEMRENLVGYLLAQGFAESEARNVDDHRMLTVAWKAAQYDKLKAAQPQINKRVAEAPKVVKAKQPTNPKVNANNELKDRLRKTGDGNVAAKLIESML